MGHVAATWKQDERNIAEAFNIALETEREYDHTCKRIPLSGSNNRRTDGSSHHGDISLPDVYDLHIELKRRASFSHQTLFDEARADAKKHGINHSVLITKSLRQKGFTALLDSELFFAMLAIPECRELLKRGNRHSVDAPKSGATRRPRKAGTKQENQDLSSSSTQDQGSSFQSRSSG